MKQLMILISLVIAISCTEKENDEPDVQNDPTGFNLACGVEFNLLNHEGEDLLNPITPNFFPFEDMKLYYLIDGEKVEVYDPLMDAPRNIMLITETTPYRLSCCTYSGLEGMTHEENGVKIGISIAYLEFNDVITDTIKTEWSYREDTSFVNDKVWYNGELHFPASEIFEVIK